MSFEIQKLSSEHFPQVLALWKQEKHPLAAMESGERIHRCLTSCVLFGAVAVREEKVLGVAAATQDGLHCYLYSICKTSGEGAFEQGEVQALLDSLWVTLNSESVSRQGRLLVADPDVKRFAEAKNAEIISIKVARLVIPGKPTKAKRLSLSEASGLPAKVLGTVFEGLQSSTVGLAAIFLGLFVWFVFAFEFSEKTIVYRVWEAFSNIKAFPELRKHDNAKIKITSRKDYIDLDTVTKVPLHLLDRNISPSMRKTTITVVKLENDFSHFYNHSVTSGSDHDVACLSGEEFTVHQVNWTAPVGEQQSKKYELAIKVADKQVNVPFALSWQTVSWNKFRDSTHQWCSVIAEYDIDDLEIVVDFPKEASIQPSDIVLQDKIRNPPLVKDVAMSTARTLYNDITGEFVWKVGKIENGHEYIVRWNKPLVP